MSRRGIESSKIGSDLPVVARVFVPAFDGITAIHGFSILAHSSIGGGRWRYVSFAVGGL